MLFKVSIVEKFSHLLRAPLLWIAWRSLIPVGSELVIVAAFTPEELQDFLSAAGFSSINILPYPKIQQSLFVTAEKE
jgi:hypothetical protein